MLNLVIASIVFVLVALVAITAEKKTAYDNGYRDAKRHAQQADETRQTIAERMAGIRAGEN